MIYNALFNENRTKCLNFKINLKNITILLANKSY